MEFATSTLTSSPSVLWNSMPIAMGAEVGIGRCGQEGSSPSLTCSLRVCKEITYAFWTPIHPGCLRCSAVKYSRVFSLLAPWQPDASTTISAQVIPSQTLNTTEPKGLP